MSVKVNPPGYNYDIQSRVPKVYRVPKVPKIPKIPKVLKVPKPRYLVSSEF